MESVFGPVISSYTQEQKLFQTAFSDVLKWQKKQGLNGLWR